MRRIIAALGLAIVTGLGVWCLSLFAIDVCLLAIWAASPNIPISPAYENLVAEVGPLLVGAIVAVIMYFYFRRER